MEFLVQSKKVGETQKSWNPPIVRYGNDSYRWGKQDLAVNALSSASSPWSSGSGTPSQQLKLWRRKSRTLSNKSLWRRSKRKSSLKNFPDKNCLFCSRGRHIILSQMTIDIVDEAATHRAFVSAYDPFHCWEPNMYVWQIASIDVECVCTCVVCVAL